jgi:hypothetical protein
LDKLNTTLVLIVTHSCEPIIDIELFVKAQEEVKRSNAPVRTRGEIHSIA